MRLLVSLTILTHKFTAILTRTPSLRSEPEHLERQRPLETWGPLERDGGPLESHRGPLREMGVPRERWGPPREPQRPLETWGPLERDGGP